MQPIANAAVGSHISIGNASFTWFDRAVRFARYSARELATASHSLLVRTFGDLDRRTTGNGAASPMGLERDQEKRRKLPGRQRAQDKCAPTPGRGMEMPTRPSGLDPIVAEIIEALARTMIRDEDRRASLPFMSTNE